LLIILSGCSGVGKNTVINELLKRNKDTLRLLKTCTTRPPRKGEDLENGPYFYFTKEEFDKKIKKGEFFEHEEIHKNFYGVLNHSLELVIKEEHDYIKDIGVLGQINLTRALENKANVISIFLTAPKQVLIERLKGRGEADIDLRLSRMEFELSYLKNYNLQIKNLNLDKTVKIIEKNIKKAKKKQIRDEKKCNKCYTCKCKTSK
jgi:guanylate kinase